MVSYEEKQGNDCHNGLDMNGGGKRGAANSSLLPWVVAIVICTFWLFFTWYVFLYVFNL